MNPHPWADLTAEQYDDKVEEWAIQREERERHEHVMSHHNRNYKRKNTLERTKEIEEFIRNGGW